MAKGLHRTMKVAASPRPRIPEPPLRLYVRPFSTACARPTTASADFWKPLRIPCGIPCRLRQVPRPPRVRTAAFTPHPPHLLHHRLMATGFALSRKLAPIMQPGMRFVFLGSGLCLRLPSDPTSRWTPLPSANSFHHQDLQRTCTPKLLPMPGTREAPRGKPRGRPVDDPGGGMTQNMLSKSNLWCQELFQGTHLSKMVELFFGNCKR